MANHEHHTRVERLLLEAARTFNTTLEYEELNRRVLHLVMAATGAEAALVFRVDHQRTDMKIRFMRTGEDEVSIFRREVGPGVLDWVANYKEPVIVKDARSDERVDREIGRMANMELRSLLTVPLIGKGHMIGVIEAINSTDSVFAEADMDVLIGLANQIAVAIDNAYLYRAMKREALEKQLLYEIGIKLSSTLNLDEVMTEVLDSLRKAIDFDGAGIYLINPESESVDAIKAIGYDTDSKLDTHVKIGEGLIGAVAKTGEPLIVPDVTADDRYIAARPTTQSEIVVPIMLDDRAVGVVNLESDRFDAYGRRAHSLMSAFASQAAISVERARLHERMISGQKLEEQLNIARGIQQSFLPRKNPRAKGYDIAGRNVPSFQVGGDYYDFIEIVESQTGIAIGDVSGKGIPAALIMASYRASLIAEIRNNYSIRTICRKVNNLLHESVQPGTFVTAVYGVLDSKNHVFTFSNCGHNLPFMLRRDGTIEYLREGGQVLGVTPNAEYEERPVYLRAGEIVVLYTDGVSEVFDSSGEEFGLDRLIDIVREHRHDSSKDIQDAIYKTITNFASPQHVFDDITTVVVKRNS